jgi:hypothetical protein
MGSGDASFVAWVIAQVLLAACFVLAFLVGWPFLAGLLIVTLYRLTYGWQLLRERPKWSRLLASAAAIAAAYWLGAYGLGQPAGWVAAAAAAALGVAASAFYQLRSRGRRAFR